MQWCRADACRGCLGVVLAALAMRCCTDTQMLASSVVDNGTGVYWLFYAGGDFAETAAPAGLACFAEGAAVESLRSAAAALPQWGVQLLNNATGAGRRF